MRYLKNEGDYTHTAISIYLQTLITFSQGHVRHDLGVNSKKKPHLQEEEKEEDEEEKWRLIPHYTTMMFLLSMLI